PADEPPPLRRNRDFTLLWLGAGVSLLGGRLSSVAYPLLIVWSGGSIAAAGLVSFAAQLPQLVVQLPAGALVDRWDRRRVMLYCDVGAGVAMTVVVSVLLSGHLWIPLLMAAAFVEGTATICYRLAERAAVRNVVHPSHLSTAFSRNEARGQAAGLLGSPLGTGLFAVLPWLPFAASAGGRVFAFGSLLRIRTRFQQPGRPASRSLRAEIAEGMTWLWRQRFLRAAISLVAGSNLVFQATSLALVLIIKQHGGSPAELGVVGIVSGLGGVAGALSGRWWLARTSAAGIVTGAFALWTVLVPLLLITPNPIVLGILFAGVSAIGATTNVTAGVYLSQICPDRMQGRVISVATLLSSGTNAFGAVAAGFALAHWGVGHTISVAAAAMALLAITAAVSPAVRSGRSVHSGRTVPE
ncbi:MAG: MFS transporter, partial [Catenulispora sp.]|nr:MFS transporter [Catenulispora sp.]